MKIYDFLALPLIVQRHRLADPTKPNPVTKVAQRLADLETVQHYIRPEALLAEIHQEIDEADIVEIRRRVVSDNDIVARIHLSTLTRPEQEALEAAQQEAKDLEGVIAPPKPGNRQQRKIKQAA